MPDTEIHNLTWAGLAVVLATGHPPGHGDCLDCNARTYQVVTRVNWAVLVQDWFIGWDAFWNVPYETVQLAKAQPCGCHFNVACDSWMLQQRARDRGPEDDPVEFILNQISEMLLNYRATHQCPRSPVQLELF